jgi:hypothetical protein
LFKHALVQDTAYTTLLRSPRQALHRRIAEALEQRFSDIIETRPEILAHHYGEAAIADRAIAYWHRAGKSSVAKSAVHEAIAQLRRGLSLLDGLPETRERNQLELDIQVTLTTKEERDRCEKRDRSSAANLSAEKSVVSRLLSTAWSRDEADLTSSRSKARPNNGGGRINNTINGVGQDPPVPHDYATISVAEREHVSQSGTALSRQL